MAGQLQRMISLVDGKMHAIQNALGADGDAFASRYYELVDQIGKSPGEDELILQSLHAHIAQYPAARDILSAEDPFVFPPLPAPAASTRAVSTGEPTASGNGGAPQTHQPEPAPVTEQSMEQPVENKKSTARRATRKDLTVDQIIMIIKESITAILALAIVFFTLTIAFNAFTYVGEEQAMADAKDILLLMLGVAGVVIGYYFGRVPADARASQAQDQAREATAQAQEIKSEAENLAADMENMLTAPPSFGVEGGARRGDGGTSFSTSGGEPAVNTEEWRKMRERVRRLSSMSRERM